MKKIIISLQNDYQIRRPFPRKATVHEPKEPVHIQKCIIHQILQIKKLRIPDLTIFDDREKFLLDFALIIAVSIFSESQLLSGTEEAKR
ncbi:MAG TPA: hypothetical protein VKA27_02865 [Sunxiuqinia sp.]|nr:hypothetical protein [Sunxiuqinia sp.]